MNSFRKSKFDEIRMPVLAVIGLMLLLVQQPFMIRPAFAGQEVSEPAKFTLSVVDKKTGKPIPNVEIKVSLSGKGISNEQKKQELSTDAGGSCTVAFPVPSPEYVRFNIKATGYVPIYASWYNSESAREPDPIPESFVFPLEKGTSIGELLYPFYPSISWSVKKIA